MEFHEVCNLFPKMTDEEFRELSFDIAKNGVLEPIWVLAGQINRSQPPLSRCQGDGFSI